MSLRVALPLLLLAHIALLPLFADYMARRPVEVKLGYVSHPQILKLTTADQHLAVAEMVVLKVIFYFGTLVQKFNENVIIRPEQANMYRTLSTAVRLDPYNMDAYYFAQAAFTWEVGRINEVNDLLEWGAQHRTWDPWLPFYIGFNHAYFLKDYAKAAHYMQRAAEISGSPLFAGLAARYLYEAEQFEFGLLFLETMIVQAKNHAVRQTYELRRDALLAIQELESAVADYRRRNGHPPEHLDNLVKAGLLAAVPVDPYGGTFYLDEGGKIRTTSKLAPIRAD